MPPKKLHIHQACRALPREPPNCLRGAGVQPRLSAAAGSEHPSPHQQLANADKFLPFPSAGLGGGLSSWESGVRAHPLSFAMQTEKINLPASSDIWAELQAGSGDKVRAKGRCRYSGERGWLAQAFVRADNSSPPCVMHNSPALSPSRSSLSLLSLLCSYRNWKLSCPACVGYMCGCRNTLVHGEEAHVRIQRHNSNMQISATE